MKDKYEINFTPFSIKKGRKEILRVIQHQSMDYSIYYGDNIVGIYESSRVIEYFKNLVATNTFNSLTMDRFKINDKLIKKLSKNGWMVKEGMYHYTSGNNEYQVNFYPARILKVNKTNKVYVEAPSGNIITLYPEQITICNNYKLCTLIDDALDYFVYVKKSATNEKIESDYKYLQDIKYFIVKMESNEMVIIYVPSTISNSNLFILNKCYVNNIKEIKLII